MTEHRRGDEDDDLENERGPERRRLRRDPAEIGKRTTPAPEPKSARRASSLPRDLDRDDDDRVDENREDESWSRRRSSRHPRDLDRDDDGRDRVDENREDESWSRRRSSRHPRDLGRDDEGLDGVAEDRPGERASRRGHEDEDAAEPVLDTRRRGDGRRERAERLAAKAERSGDARQQQDKTNDDADDSKTSEQRRKNRRPLIIGIAAVVAVLLVAGGIFYWLANRDLVDTDDAYTDGRAAAIAPRVSGQVISLDVSDNQFVHKGDPLIHIDPRQFIFDRDQAKGALDAAKAQVDNQVLGVEIAKKNFPATLLSAQGALTSAKANLALQEFNYQRQKSLPKAATTQQEVDTATSNYQQAEAQVQEAQARVTEAEPVPQNIGQTETRVNQLKGQLEQAQASFDQAELNIEWTIVRAPQDGWVTRRNVDVGNYLTAGQQIMSIVSPEIWVTANFKETQLDGMRPGQRVKIQVDAHPELDLRGHVDSIQRGTGSKFSAFPAENATGNFVKIVQRVPVKIIIDSGLNPDTPMPLGLSVTPTVTLR